MPTKTQFAPYTHGLPVSWQDQGDDALATAVQAFRERRPSASQLQLLRNYCKYYLDAPGWKTTNEELTFMDLRERIGKR